MKSPVGLAAKQEALPETGKPRCWLTTLVWGLILIAAAGIGFAFVYFKIFSVFKGYDDEGFVLLSLKAFIAGKPLYDEVYSMYQPAFYVFHWLLFGLLGAGIGHDNIRLLTLAFWLAAAALNGAIAHRLTGKIFWGAVVSLISLRALESFANEPGHPQAMGCVLVECIIALCAFSPAVSPRTLSIGLGFLLGLTLLTKINVGIFVALPLSFLVLTCRSGKVASALRLIVGMLMLSLPSLLWRTRLKSNDTPLWTLFAFDGLAVFLLVSAKYLNFRAIQGAICALCASGFTLGLITDTTLAALPVYNAGLLTLGIGTVLLMVSAQPGVVRAGQFEWKTGALTLVVAMVVMLLIILLRGTTLHGLISGLLIWPGRVATSFQIRPRSNSLGLLLSLAGALTCCGYLLLRARLSSRTWFRAGIALAQIILGLLLMAEYYFRRPGSSTLMPVHPSLPHFWMLPFTWLGLAGEPAREGANLGRLALLLVAVMQPLIACPVAGTQLVPASILLIAVAAVLLASGFSTLSRSVELPLRLVRWEQLAGMAGAVLLLVPLGSENLQLRAAFAESTPLDLPGATRIRLTSQEVRTYHQVVAKLAAREVGTFLTLPGMDSFYLWSHKEPPNGLNVSAWVVLLDDEEQERIWRAARQFRGLKVVRNRRLLRSWVGGRSVSALPLVRHIDEEFVPVASFGDYELLERKTELQ